MIITGMRHFESVCIKKLVEWYNGNDDLYHTQKRIVEQYTILDGSFKRAGRRGEASPI